MDRHSGGGGPPPHLRGRPVSGLEAAHANEYFDPFLNATTLKNILGYHRSMCEFLHLKPNVFPHFYPKLRANLTSWRAKAVWKKFDARASHKCYAKGKACAGTRVLVIGGGPCGLRSAIEAQLLGAKVVVIEKRDRLSRNNVLHLWPFVIEDLRMLGAKKFFGKFCAGAIDHISIRQLQCILLKVALLLGVEIHTEVSFESVLEPSAVEKTGWRAKISPDNHPVAQYEFDVIIGADGKRNTLQGFKRKEFRGKLAIAITANFINKKSEAEARVEEISGVAFIFNQKFFKDLQGETRIDLENIVYYKDDTHYFVMTAKKASLLEKGVIKQDLTDTEKLLAPDNVDRDALQNYARQAADFSTNYQLPELEFAVNHYGQPDVAMFDFTSMYAAEYASKVVERHGNRLLMMLVGDSLLEPFWPTGSGCARGFLSSLDAAWAIRSYCSGQVTPLDVLAERESIYRLLAQTTPDNLNKDWKAYTLDPATRYPNLNKNVVTAHQTVCLYDTDVPDSIDRMKRASLEASRHEHVTKKRRRGIVDNDVLLTWLNEQLRDHEDIKISDIPSVFRAGHALCAIVHHYRPDLLDYSAIKDIEATKCNQLAMDILEKDLGLPPFMTGEEITNTEDYLAMATYLTQVYDTFRGEIPHIKHPKLELPEKRDEPTRRFVSHTAIPNAMAISLSVTNHRPPSRHKRNVDVILPKPGSADKKLRKRRTLEKHVPGVAPSIEQRQKTLEEIAANRIDRQSKRKQQRQRQTEQFIKSMQMLQANCKPDCSEPFEDYSIFLYRQTAPKFKDRVKDLEKQFTYVPDHDNKITGLKPLANTNAEEDIASKIKSLEDKWSGRQHQEKKPKDLMRAIGKIETSDWNIKQIEKKILENKIGKPSSLNADKERVPRWSREEFKARQTKMEKKGSDKQEIVEGKYADIDRNIKQLELKLKEGTNRELGQNKVASITEKLVSKAPEKDKPVEKPAQPRQVNLPVQSGSEFCHFCQKRVYLMERLSAEGRFFHHGCFKCQYCHSQLRLGSYMFDRDGQYGYRFFCMHHYGMQGELPRPTKVARKPSHKREAGRSPHKKPLSGVAGVDLLDRVQTPERIEFSNLSGNISSDHEEPLSQMDEDEWTDKNFGQSCNELDESDEDSSSSISDTDSDDEDAFDDALEQPITKEGTMKWAERWKNSYRRGHHNGDSDGYSSSDHSSYYENSSDDSESDTATEGEEEIRARELRRQEVRVEPPIVQTDTGTDTEMVSEESSSESEPQNSATEISTDSEFAQDEPTPTREVPAIALNDFYVTKTRGSGNLPKKIQVKSGFIEKNHDIELKLTPLVPSSDFKPGLNKENYALNRTQSTGGIAAKVSLELKKKYLLGDNSNAIQKSGSASTLENKFKSFQSTISDCQKLLKPATEVSAGMQVFCAKLDQMSPQKKNLPDITITTSTDPIPSSDSLSLSSENEAPSYKIPTVQIEPCEEIALDSLSPEANKSITSDKKTLNQPKNLPELDNVMSEIHENHSSPDGTVLTETELSDWARDENVSDSIEFELGQDKPTLAKLSEFEEIPPKNFNNLDNIEFMDTGTETSSEDGVIDSQNGYVLLKNDDEPMDSLNLIIETRNPVITVDNFGGEVQDLKPQDLEQLKLKQNQTEHEEDSLLIIDTTTEENTTCSDSTVKNVTEIPSVKLENLQKQRLEEKLAKVKEEMIQYESHCHRLQSKVDFNNAKDSIDIRKLKKRDSKPDLIEKQPEKLPLSPDVIYTKENIKKERDVNRKLIEEMVMNKMKSENKTLERKRRSRPLLTLEKNTPDLVSSSIKLPETPLTNPENFKLDEFKTPKPPPRYNRPSDVIRSTEKMKENARARARLLSNEDLGLSPEDKINKLREKILKKDKNEHVLESIESLVLNTERRNSMLYSNDTLSKKNSFRRSKSREDGLRPKSVVEIPKLTVSEDKKFCKSDPNLLEGIKKGKDRERRKSFSKLIAGIFCKSPPKLFAKLSPRSKAVSKSLSSLYWEKYYGDEAVQEEPKYRHSISQQDLQKRELTPPPVPPLPVNYTMKNTDESSDGELLDPKSSCDTLASNIDNSFSGTGRKSGKARRMSRQTQLKRHRMAQEIQRKLEETEVKTRELEKRGVEVEKALRREDGRRSSKEENELLQDWFDLMRDRTELRRYEKELMTRAQELELEDRHSRLQMELRERLERKDNKTEEDLKTEEGIINEMMDIVAKRDTLIAVLEEDRLRYSHEDKDLEEQMLAKGLMLTSIQKSPEKS